MKTTETNEEETIKSGYRRVTDILGPQTGYGSIPDKILRVAADRGTRVHAAIAEYLRGRGMWHEEPEDIPYLDSFEKWWKEGSEITSLETRYYCDKYMLTGQCDVILQKEGKNILIDWKTSVKVNDTWRYQGAAYRHLMQGTYDIDEVWFVKLCKKGGEPEVIKYARDECEANFLIFIKCIEIYEIFHAGKRKQIIEEWL